MNNECKRKEKIHGMGRPLEIIFKETNNIYRNLFVQILARRISFKDFHCEKEDEKEIVNVLNVLKNAGLIDSSGAHYYPTSLGLRKARELNILERPKAWI